MDDYATIQLVLVEYILSWCRSACRTGHSGELNFRRTRRAEPRQAMVQHLSVQREKPNYKDAWKYMPDNYELKVKSGLESRWKERWIANDLAIFN